MNFKKLLQQCFGLLSPDNTFLFRSARFSKRDSDSRRRLLSRYQPAAEVCETRVMLSAIVVDVAELKITADVRYELAVANNESALFATQTPGEYLLLSRSAAFEVNFYFASADQLTPEPIKPNGEVADSVNVADLVVDAVLETPGDSVIVTEPLSLTDLNSTVPIWSQFNLSSEQFEAREDFAPNSTFRYTVDSKSAPPLSISFSPLTPTTKPTTRRSGQPQPEVVIQIATESPGLFASEAGQQALIQYLRPLVQSNAFVGLFNLPAVATSRWMTISRATSIVHRPTFIVGAFKIPGAAGDIPTEFNTVRTLSSQTTDNNSQSPGPIVAISQLISTAWYSPVDQLISQSSTSQESIDESHPQQVVASVTRFGSAVTPQAFLAIGLKEPISKTGRRRKTPAKLPTASKPPVHNDQSQVDRLVDSWLTQFLVDQPQIDQSANGASAVDPIWIVSSEPQFARASDATGTQQSRKLIATFDPQSVLVESDTPIQSENDRPPERAFFVAVLRQLRFEQGPRGPPSHQTIDTGFDLNRASQLRLKMLRHSLAPRSPSTVSVA